MELVFRCYSFRTWKELEIVHAKLLLGFLKNPKYKQMPVLEFIENYIVDLEKKT